MSNRFSYRFSSIKMGSEPRKIEGVSVKVLLVVPGARGREVRKVRSILQR